jgi:uncharacterized repeat protein (TIGR01451 family)
MVMTTSSYHKIRHFMFHATLVLACLFAGASYLYAAGTPAGTTITNTATINWSDASSNNYTQNASVSVTVNAVYTVSVNAPVDQSGNSNTPVYYAYTVTNTGNANNTFALSAASGGGGNTWTVTLYADDGAGGGTANDGFHQAGETTVINSTGALAADATYKFFVAVAIPLGTINAQTDDTVLTVIGSGDGGAGDDTSDTVTTTANAPVLTIAKEVRNVTTAGAFGAGAAANPGHVLEYRFSITNSGPVQATSVVLTDPLNANLTYVANSIWIGSNNAGSAAPNLQKTDAAAGDPACAVDACGAANYNAGTITAYLGNTATELAGGTLNNASTVYIFFRATVK